MPDRPSAGDLEKWHRWFAVECNNTAWDLAERTTRSEAENAQLLDAAHAAAFHWTQSGTELNVARARLLLAQAHALVGHGAIAVQYARESRVFLLAHDGPGWEVALVHVVSAHAAAVAGQNDDHRTFYQKAVASIEAIAGDAEKEVVMASFVHVPEP